METGSAALSGLARMSWKRVAFGAAAAIGVASCARAATISGVYVAAGPGRVELLQIVRTSDGHLDGRVEDVTLTDAGAIQDNAIAVEGAADGQQFTLSPKSGIVAAFGGSFTGVAQGNKVNLSWQGGHAILVRSDTNTFDADVAALRTQATQIVAERDARNAAANKAVAARNLLSLAQQVSQELDALDQASPGIIEGLSRVDDQYATLGRQAQRKRTQQRMLAAIGGEGVAAGSAGIDAQGVMIRIDGVHISVNGVRGQVREKVSQILSGLSAVDTACKNDPLVGQPSDPCPTATDLMEHLKRTAAPLHEAFEKAEGAYADAATMGNARPRNLTELFNRQ